MTLQLVVDYPDAFPDAVGRIREQFEMEAKWAMAVKLFYNWPWQNDILWISK